MHCLMNCLSCTNWPELPHELHEWPELPHELPQNEIFGGHWIPFF